MARHRSFSGAARELAVTRSAVSQTVRQGYDAGVRLSEALERDMVQVRLTDPFRFVVVGAPDYLARRGTPQRPEDLLRHECITFRSPTTGALYAWELERGRRTWRVPVRGGVVASDAELIEALAEGGLGLAYTFEPRVFERLRAGRLRRVLEAYAPTVPGFFLYYPGSAKRSAPLRLFIDTARELAAKAMASPERARTVPRGGAVASTQPAIRAYSGASMITVPRSQSAVQPAVESWGQLRPGLSVTLRRCDGEIAESTTTRFPRRRSRRTRRIAAVRR